MYVHLSTTLRSTPPTREPYAVLGPPTVYCFGTKTTPQPSLRSLHPLSVFLFTASSTKTKS